VTKVVAFGAFVEILPGVEGLVHISELADHHVENPSEVVEPGSKLNVKILEIDEERRRLSLSIKQVEGQNMAMAGLGEQIAQAEGGQDDGSEEQVDPPSGSMADAFAEAAAADTAAEETQADEAPSEEAPSEEAPGDLPQEVEASEDAEPAPVAEENGTTEESADPAVPEGEEAESVEDAPGAGSESTGEDAQTGESEQG
jgi:small subunit ribosomal protein S1